MFSLFAGSLLGVGTPAPGFTLPDENGTAVTLSALRGKNVVLVFYPGDDTMVCTRQLCQLRDSWHSAGARNTLVFGGNPQGTESHARFREKFALPFPLLIDKGRKVCALYHARGLWVTRTVYLIGPDGVIRFARRGVPAVSEILAAAG
ncbi:MAG: peroxiredoxin [Acidobacteria bacterium]|nr:peroxiredoxin [Acidobacteriota bacterium]